MTWNYNDAHHALPANTGRYEIFHRFLGRFYATWKGGWFWENGERVPDGIIRYWR